MLGSTTDWLLEGGIVQVGSMGVVSVGVGDEVDVGGVDVLGNRVQPMLRMRPRTRMKARAEFSILFTNFILTHQMLRNS
jgi:hypothetical protein